MYVRVLGAQKDAMCPWRSSSRPHRERLLMDDIVTAAATCRCL
jgi:hypothetical protein